MKKILMPKRFMKSEDVQNLKPQNAQWSVCHYLSAVMERAKRKLHEEERELRNFDANRNATIATGPTNGATDMIITPVINDDQPSTTPGTYILNVKLNIEASIGIPETSNAKIPVERTSKKRKIEDSTYIPESSKPRNNKKKKHCERSINIIRCKKAEVSHGPSPPPPLPEKFMEAIRRFSEGRSLSGEFKLVIQKRLYASDLKPGQNRLLIPANQVVTADFLNEEEKRSIGRPDDEKNNIKLKFMEVMVIDPDLQLRTLNLNKWDMKSSFNYVLNGKWMEIVRRCKLEPEMVLQVWSFRVDGVLGFALVRL